MAENLDIKLKVNSTEVTSGLEKAKKDVKKSADDMANDVKQSSAKMEKSFEDVAKSTDKIKDATKNAGDSVKSMEKSVDQSSKNMEKSLDGVSKKLSAMTAFSVGDRGIGIIGGLASDIAKSYGADDTASNIGVATGMAQNSMQGAAAGFAMAGPMGAVAGGLLGAAQSLMKAGNDLQNAAKAQDEKARSDLEAQRQTIIRNESRAKWTEEARSLAYDAYGDETTTGTEEGRVRLNSAIADAQNRVNELTARRDAIAKNYDPDGDVFAQAEQMRALNDSIEFATERLNILTQVAEQAAEADRRWTEQEEAATKAAEQAVEARKQEAQAARKRAEAEEERAAKEHAAEEARAAREAEDAAEKEKRKQISDAESKQREGEATLASLQKELGGVANFGGTPTDALTKMGGGVGYTGYNTSVEQVQRSIESNLKTLIQNQTDQNKEIINRLEDLRGHGDSPSRWGEQ